MKRTLLQMVTEVAANISSDEVSTLATDSIEVQDILRLTKNALEDLLNRNEWEFLRDQPMLLEAGTALNQLTIPTNVRKIQTVKYRRLEGGAQTGFTTLRYMLPAEFLERLQKNKPTDANTDTVTIGGVEAYIRNNKQPRYWTSFDELTVHFDSYDAAQNASGIDAADSAILATVHMDWTGSDDETWIAPIPQNVFTLWLQEATADCSVKLRQAEDSREERKSRRSYIQQIRKEPVTHKDEGSQGVNYGR